MDIIHNTPHAERAGAVYNVRDQRSTNTTRIHDVSFHCHIKFKANRKRTTHFICTYPQKKQISRCQEVMWSGRVCSIKLNHYDVCIFEVHCDHALTALLYN